MYKMFGVAMHMTLTPTAGKSSTVKKGMLDETLAFGPAIDSALRAARLFQPTTLYRLCDGPKTSK